MSHAEHTYPDDEVGTSTEETGRAQHTRASSGVHVDQHGSPSKTSGTSETFSIEDIKELRRRGHPGLEGIIAEDAPRRRAQP
jgi:hypothetical protein